MRRPSKWMRGKPGIAVSVIIGILALYSIFGGKSPSPRPAGGPGVAAESQQIERSGPMVFAARADFDFYLLALSWHPAFCADGHRDKSECRVWQPHPLAIHGLWPEKLQPGSYPHDCRAPRLALASALAHQLEEYMPGMQSNLHDHEWRTHGGCSGLDDDDYFQQTLDRARGMDAALRMRLTSLAGRETTPAELRAAADAYRAGLGATITFQCRTLRDAPAALRNRPFLIEVRQCIDDDGAHGAPGTPLDCASVERRDQGCGRSFRIAELTR